MSKPLVLMVDDDAELSAMVGELLEREGWAVHTVLTAGDGERALAQHQPEAVLLDVMLPDANGFDVCRRWRAAHPTLGIVMLTARGDPMDRVLGLEIGADDYLPKPFEPRELVARVRALLRQCALAITGGEHGVHRPAFAFEQFGHHARQLGVIVDHQDQRLAHQSTSVLCTAACSPWGRPGGPMAAESRGGSPPWRQHFRLVAIRRALWLTPAA